MTGHTANDRIYIEYTEEVNLHNANQRLSAALENEETGGTMEWASFWVDKAISGL